MQGFETTVTNLISTVQPYTYILAAVAVIVCGIMMVAGGQRGREAAKAYFPWIILGSILILGATQIAKMITTSVSF